mgnify:CR=1 FL=1
MKTFNLSDIDLTKYLFFTGKGGVGKTSIACATAVGLADNGKKILLISTDPASNLQDVFNQTLNGHGTDIQEVPGLTVVNLDPEQAAAEYRESVIAPFRGQLPESVIQNMEEQLSGSCTVEIAASSNCSKRPLITNSWFLIPSSCNSCEERAASFNGAISGRLTNTKRVAFTSESVLTACL